MRIAICDDNADDRTAIKTVLMKYAAKKSIDFEYTECESGNKLIYTLRDDGDCPEIIHWILI